MKKITCVLAILAAASTAAVAKEHLKQDKKATAPAIAAAQMSDADMDKVTAGAGYGPSTIYVPGPAVGRTNNAIYGHGAAAPFLSGL